MSFGLSESSVPPETFKKIQKTIRDASHDSILLFAAASNCGGNGSRTYPANDSRVICAHAVDGSGNDNGGFNPPIEGYTDRFSTLGVAIECSWDGKSVYKSGTSYATPILAGIAANVLDYAAHAVSKGRLVQTTFDRIRERDGMAKIFHFMSRKIVDHYYVTPWGMWGEKATDDYICSKLRVEL
jgi:hypothetical protein